ncbi:MAG TPA: hypothetical protein VK158_00950 [Acidobacteriota bacterium]|nr:hypothetical protein [Acidobacteriota bacterium]
MEANEKIILTNIQPPVGANSDAVANTIIARIGLMPRKQGSTPHMFRTLIEFYERAKKATAQKDPKLAVMTVEEMAIFAKITRQTMYEYLQRWLELTLIQKVSYIDSNNKVIIGYKLNGSSIEEAFEKAKKKIVDNLDETQKLIGDLQKMLKNEKISASMKKQEEPSESL